MRLQKSKRSGKVVVLVAVCLTVLMGVTAFALDGGLLQDNKQRAQSTADASAMAAANVLFLKWQQNAGRDVDGSAAAAANTIAAQNGFPNPTVNIPPKSGPFAKISGYVEVIVNYDQKRYFSRVYGTADIHVTARAVAQGRWTSFDAGILVLHPTDPGAFTNTGGGTVSVTGVPLIVNSNAPDAATGTGNGTTIATHYQITGEPGTSGSGTFIGPINSGVPPTPDPLAYLPEPSPVGMPVQTKGNSGLHFSNGNRTISPGVYRGGIKVSGQGNLTMEPGIYYMDGGGFEFTGQGNLTANGVMIFNDPHSNSDNISISGTGTITLSPMTTGIYAGISLFQKRSSDVTMNVSGNGGSSMTGTFYTAGAMLNVTGNGSNNVVGSQYISNWLTVNGNGSFVVNWTPQATARIRVLNLTE